MDTDKMLDLRRALYDRLGRVVELEGLSQKRSLSRRELAEVAQIKREAEQLRAQLPPEFDPRAAMPGKRESVDVVGDCLTPEQRVADWQRQRGDLRTRDAFDDPGPLSLGKMVRGAVTGNWKDAEAEQRSLVEGTLANGGYLLAPELAGSVIDRVRNAMQVMRAGATTVPMTTEQLYLARLAGGASPTWKIENDPVSDSTPARERR